MTAEDGQQINQAMLRLKDEFVAERFRMRKAFVWFFSFLLFCVLAAAVIVLGAGLAMLRQTAVVVENLEWLEDQIAGTSIQLGGLSNRVSQLSRTQVDLSSRINSLQLTQQQAVDQLRIETERHQRWIASRETQLEIERVGLDQRLNQRGEALDQLAVAVARLQARLDDPAVGVVPPIEMENRLYAQVEPSREDERPDWAALLDSFDGVSLPDIFEEVSEHVDPGYAQTTSSRTISVVTFPNGDRYEGTFESGLMHGWGIYTRRNGERYEGQFYHDLNHGNGTLIMRDGTRYEGVFVRGIRQGLGRLAKPDGTRYVGEFGNDMINGRGIMLYPDGSQFAGDFMNGQRHGHGIHRFANGDMYKGEFRQDLRTGSGLYVFADGSRYEGNFVEGVRHGRGHYRFADGSEFIGEFRNGLMHGEGVRIIEGRRIRGVWHEGEHVRDL